ncbi:MAG: DUF1611 domain-containing protein [Candidatus Eisenbacteria bacterium]
MLGRPRRLVILAEGRFTPLDAKTAVGVLRYRPEEVAAVLDSTRAGRTAHQCVGTGGATPVVATLTEAATRGADTLMIGVAPQGGRLPAAWRDTVLEALGRGWDVVAGLHDFLADDPELAAAARTHGATLIDARRPPDRTPIATRRAAEVDALVVLTVGSDCNVGKMTAALELTGALQRSGTRAAFVATGQTGIFCADRGIAVDAVRADFVAGFTEEMVLAAAADADVVVVEGQGSLHHPGYSGVTLGLLHGACPTAMVFCHEAGRETVRRPGGLRDPGDPVIPPLPELVRVYELAAGWVHPARVVGVALNTLALEPAAAREAVTRAARETGLPVCDPVRDDAALLADAVAAAARERRDHASHT